MSVMQVLNFPLIGATGTLNVNGNQGFNEAQFFTFINNSPNTVSVFGSNANPATDLPQLIVPPGSSQEYIIPSGCRDGFIMVYASPGNTKSYPLMVYITSERTNISSSAAAAYSAVSLNTIAQLPTALSAGGNLKVENPVQLPAALSAGGNLKVDIVESGISIPCSEQGKQWASHVFAGAGNYNFKATAGTVFAMQASVAAGQQLNDSTNGTTPAWKQGDVLLSYPINCLTGINVLVTGACTVWVLFN